MAVDRFTVRLGTVRRIPRSRGCDRRHLSMVPLVALAAAILSCALVSGQAFEGAAL